MLILRVTVPLTSYLLRIGLIRGRRLHFIHIFLILIMASVQNSVFQQILFVIGLDPLLLLLLVLLGQILDDFVLGAWEYINLAGEVPFLDI